MKELNQLASKLVGDGKKPKLYFVCENAKCVMITTDGEAAYKKWKSLPISCNPTLENRNGMVCDVQDGERIDEFKAR